MARKGYNEEQIKRTLRHAESGTRMHDICREYGISDATFYIWKKKYAGFGLSELRQVREENAKLKRLVADLSLDQVRKVVKPCTTSARPICCIGAAFLFV